MTSTLFARISTKKISACIGLLSLCLSSFASNSSDDTAEALHWTVDPCHHCNGTYEDLQVIIPKEIKDSKKLLIKSSGGHFSPTGTTELLNATIWQRNEELHANRIILTRDETTHDIKQIELQGHVEGLGQNALVVADKVTMSANKLDKEASHVLYRTKLKKKIWHRKESSEEVSETNSTLNTTHYAFGEASTLEQHEENVWELEDASYSTCPPINPSWQMHAKHMTLDQNKGRGTAYHVRLHAFNTPVLYIPYVNFPLNHERKTGFLWPALGSKNGYSYIRAPFYWNIAPNYDDLLSPTIYTHRGLLLDNQFRYLNEQGRGNVKLTLLPSDSYFFNFRAKDSVPQVADSEYVQASRVRLANSSTTRKAIGWQDDRQYNDHFSSHVNFNAVSDDYFLRDFGTSLSEVTQNQLVQEAELDFKSDHWQALARIQGYQTLHPIDPTITLNQYRRFPQFFVSGQYPDQMFGLTPFISAETTNFDIHKTPGTSVQVPIGQRLHTQPGISLPLQATYGFVTPRIQVALSHYRNQQTNQTATPDYINRSIPIFDIASGMTLERRIELGGQAFKQTLEPQLYYTYIPYRDQVEIPLFDTTIYVPNYDQLFTYNRFSGIDRIGDANQIAIGVSTRFFEQENGFEKLRLSLGTIWYFQNRRVTLCEDTTICNDTPEMPVNRQRLSPLSATLNYHLDPRWMITGNLNTNIISKKWDTASIIFQYQPNPERVINLGYHYINKESQLGLRSVDAQANAPLLPLKITDLSANWPITTRFSAVGRISHDWQDNRLQNILYGIQYDTCCFAVRFVGGRSLVGNTVSNNSRLSPLYSQEHYIQISLKGLGNLGNGSPTALLNTVAGYNTSFG